MRSIMQPLTPHCVLTLMESVVFGKHFWSALHLQESCLGVVHTLLEQSLLTNTAHPRTIGFIGLFLKWWKSNENMLGSGRDNGKQCV